jgi:hypothetical protein
MRHPSAILFPLAFALLAFASGLHFGAQKMAEQIYEAEARNERDPRMLVFVSGYRASHLSRIAWQVAAFGLIAVLSAGFARLKCESEDRVRWKRLILFVAVTTAVVIGSAMAYLFWQLQHMGENC